MTAPLALAASLATNAARVPYITAAEYQNAPNGVSSANLVAGGSAAQNAAELMNVIARASSWVDGYCQQVLAATSDTDPVRRVRVNADGLMIIPLRFTPVRMVTAISYGPTPSTMSAVSTANAADISIGSKTVEVPVVSSTLPVGEFPQWSVGSRLLAQVSYVNGYPNTTLTEAVTAATSLPVADTTGILVGDTLTVYDDTDGIQQVTVTGAWSPGPTGPGSVPVTPAVTASSGVSVSALPPAVKDACILLVTARIKARGSASLKMGTTTTPGTATPNDPAGPDVAAAKAILAPYRRVA